MAERHPHPTVDQVIADPALAEYLRGDPNHLSARMVERQNTWAVRNPLGMVATVTSGEIGMSQAVAWHLTNGAEQGLAHHVLGFADTTQMMATDMLVGPVRPIERFNPALAA